MKNLFIIYFCMVLAACSAKEPPEALDTQWPSEAKAIFLKFSASADLNMDQGRPASLMVCLYQMSEPYLFEELSKGGEKGLSALAACRPFGEAVLSGTRHFVEPGQALSTVTIDRREGAKFVGIAAGYYHLSPRDVRLYPIGIKRVRDGWFTKRTIPAPLTIELNFGPNWPEAPMKKGK